MQRLIEPLEGRLFLAAQAYDWGNVTIKGTGFVNGIVFSKAQQGLVYANTDMGGAYRWDSAASKWVPLTDWVKYTDWSINYMGAESLAADPTDANRVYLGFGTSYGYGGNDSCILRSSDQGRTWQRTNVSFAINGNGAGRGGAQRMQVDPNSPNLLFYGTRKAGIWKSSDYGASWSKLGGFAFTNDASGVAADVGVVWTLIDKSSATAGTPSPVLYAAASTTGDNKIYRSLDGGTTWNPVPGQPTGSTLFPISGTLSADGNTLYLTYAVGDVGPNNVSNGYVYKVTNPDAATPSWSALTIDSPHGQGGWGGIAIDPTNPSRMYVSTLDRWWPSPYDQIYRTTNAGTSWTALNPNSNRNDSSSGWSSTTNLHWLLDVEVDPFDANHVMFTTGFGIFSSSNATATTPTWSFFNNGLEQSAALELASPNTGSVHLLSAIGDQDGFRHVDFAVSPPKLGQANGISAGTSEDIDTAWSNANYVVRLTGTSPYVQYSNDNGVNWAWMPSTGLSSAYGGNLAMSADGTKIVYEQGGTGRVVYSTRSGSTWGNWVAPAINRPDDGARIVADLSASQTLYAYQNTTVWRTTDGGANWTVMTTTAPAGGTWLRAVQGNAGHLLMSGYNLGGLYRSTDGGATWSKLNSATVTRATEVGVGAAAPAQSYPAIFIVGTVSGQDGIFRSDDQGATWIMVSDLAHQYGDVTVIQGDPRVYGRVYVGANGRGVSYGDIHTPQATLPAGWSTQDINAPGSTGSAGEASGTWELIGGGSGIAGTSDQFRFAYTTLSGDGSITAKVLGVPNRSPANNNAKAGVMIRSSLAANSANAFVAITPGSVSGALFQTRSTAGGSTPSASATTGIWPPYWVRLVRSGNTFTAYRSPDGATWTQLGSTQTIAMGTTVYIGLAVTASDNTQLNASQFSNVSITTPPVAALAPVAPDPRTTAVPSVAITFNQAVSGFDLSDLSLSRDGYAISLAGATLTSSDGGITWTLGNLSSLTANVGTYTLTLTAAGSGITAGGWALAGDASESWTMNALSASAEIELRRNGAMTEYRLSGAYQYSFSPTIASLAITGSSGADTLIVNLSDGNPLPGSASFDGGSGDDAISIIGSSGADAITLASGSATIGSANLSLATVERRIFDGMGGGDDVTLNGGSVLFPATQRLDVLSIAGGASAIMAAGGDMALYAGALTIGPGGALDLNDNDMVVAGGSFTTIQQLVFAGYSAAPDSAKAGIISSTGQSAGNTILALLDNALVGASDWPPGSGQTIAANAIIGRYTLFGDANLDGAVTADDYAILDANLDTLPPPGAAWLSGDANMDGSVTSDDYAILDANLGLGLDHLPSAQTRAMRDLLAEID